MKINLLVWLDRICVWPVLLYRYCKFGYTFRRIYLGEGKWTILEQPDFYRLRKFKWVAHASGRGGPNLYAIRHKLISPSKTKMLYMHREIMNPTDDRFVDHRNCDSLDNRRSNLRFATRSENMRNRRKKKNTTSQFVGVNFYKPSKKWDSRITHQGKRIKLGRFVSEIEAARAYDEAAKKYYGEFARLNFPEEDERSRALFTRVRDVFEQISGGAAQGLAYCIKRGKANRTRLVGFEDRKIIEGYTGRLGKLGEFHPPVKKNVIESNVNHLLSSLNQRFGFFNDGQ